MSFEVGDLDVARAAALLAAAARSDHLGMKHHVEEAHAEGRCHLLAASIVQCVSDAMGADKFYNEQVAQHYSRIAAHHRNKYDEQMETLAAQQDSDTTEEEGDTKDHA